MRYANLWITWLVLMGIGLGGCGVGGFQGPDNTGSSSPQSNALLKRVTGQVSKGPVAEGQVNIYNLNSNGSAGQLLKTTSTNAFGQYTTSVNISGPSLFVITGGSYTDEATGQSMTIPADTPLRAAKDTVSATMSVAVTPLTELAVRQTGGLLTATNIATANQMVSEIFKFDVLTTQPLAPTADDFAQLTAGQSQKDYALALAAISQMASDYYNGSISAALTAMAYDLTTGTTLGHATGSQFQTSLKKFLASNRNMTKVSDINNTNLVNAGGGTLTLKLATVGTLPAGATVSGVQATITLPSGVSIRVGDFNDYQAVGTVVYASGTFANAQYSTGRYVPAVGGSPATLSVAVVQATGSSLGEFLTVVCDMPIGSTYRASDFSLSSFKVVDYNSGADLPGITVEIH